MRSISNGFSSDVRRIDIEACIEAFVNASMRFYLAGCAGGVGEHVSEADSAGDTALLESPFVNVMVSIDSARASFVAPGMHLNYYLDWLTFDKECEQGIHSVETYDDRPSNMARRTYFEAFAHSIVISIKSGLDRLVSVLWHFYPGLASHVTWGRISKEKASGFMSVVVRDKENDQLLQYLNDEYERWIAAAVAPRDDVIHYADLVTGWHYEGSDHFSVTHHGAAVVADAAVLCEWVTSFYALAAEVLLVLEDRTPNVARRREPVLGSNLGRLIMEAFDLEPSPQVGELVRLIKRAVRNGELSPSPSSEDCVDFLRANAAGLIPES